MSINLQIISDFNHFLLTVFPKKKKITKTFNCSQKPIETENNSFFKIKLCFYSLRHFKNNKMSHFDFEAL